MAQPAVATDPVICIDTLLNGLSDTPSNCCIFRIHKPLRQVNEQAYDPEIVAIGPYHRDNENLKMMEEHKLRYFRSLLQKKPENDSNKYVNAIRPLQQEGSLFYAKPVSLTADEMIQIMVLDGCFIIELLRKSEMKLLRDQDDPIFKLTWMVNSLQRDLMLFENQLPFSILCKLFDLIEAPHNHDRLIYLALRFFNDVLPGTYEMKAGKSDGNIRHLLELVHNEWLPLSVSTPIANATSVSTPIGNASSVSISVSTPIGNASSVSTTAGNASSVSTSVTTPIGNTSSASTTIGNASSVSMPIGNASSASATVGTASSVSMPIGNVSSMSATIGTASSVSAPIGNASSVSTTIGTASSVSTSVITPIGNASSVSIPVSTPIGNASSVSTSVSTPIENTSSASTTIGNASSMSMPIGNASSMSMPIGNASSASATIGTASSVSMPIGNVSSVSATIGTASSVSPPIGNASSVSMTIGTASSVSTSVSTSIQNASSVSTTTGNASYVRTKPIRNASNKKGKGNWRFIPNTTELQEAGVKLKKFEVTGGSLFDIKFDKGKLYIPPLTVEDRTESIFRNLIAYEQYCPDNQRSYVTDYVKFLDCLIDSPKDVEILSGLGIIDNWLSDDEAVSNIFTKISDAVSGTSMHFRYADIFNRVNIYCGQRCNRWMAILKRNYCNGPWAIISILAGSFLLLFTLAQTLYAVFPFRKL